MKEIDIVNKILANSGKPKVFQKGTSNFWTDQHISKYMLEAHLNPEWDAASRKFEIIDKTVKWINDEILKRQSQILDLGCGPGLYAERLCKLGHNVTGIDFSERSINYAKKSSVEKGLDVEYVYGNYLDIEYDEEFDLIMIIYCDLGALSNTDRNILLQKVYKALKPGGIFIFDAFTEKFADKKEAKREWNVQKEGFWAGEKHVVLSETFHYPEEKVTCDQHIVIQESGRFEVYRSYDHYYSEEDIAELLDGFGFRKHRFYYEVFEDSTFGPKSVVFSVTRK